MMTNPNENPQQENDARIEDFRDVANIRVLRQNGFFGVTLPVMHVLPGTMAQISANWTAPFFRANRTYQVLECVVRFEHEDTNVGTLDLYKVASGTAPASGTSVLTAPIPVDGAVNTDTLGTISDVSGVAILPVGTCLCLKPKNVPQMLDMIGLTVFVLLKAI